MKIKVPVVVIEGDDGDAYIRADKITMVQAFKADRKVVIRYADVEACEHVLHVTDGDPNKVAAKIFMAWGGDASGTPPESQTP